MKQWVGRIGMCLLLIGGAAQAADTVSLGAALDLQHLPQKVVMIDPHLEVKELSAGGVSERVDAWSDQAKKSLLEALS